VELAALGLEVEVEDDTEVTSPLPEVAVPVETPAAFCEPAPVRPGPFPAPLFMYLAAPDGIAGRASPETSQVELLAGQPLEPPVELKPPSPVGLGVAL
jgi:hypothetical protein